MFRASRQLATRKLLRYRSPSQRGVGVIDRSGGDDIFQLKVEFSIGRVNVGDADEIEKTPQNMHRPENVFMINMVNPVQISYYLTPSLKPNTDYGNPRALIPTTAIVLLFPHDSYLSTRPRILVASIHPSNLLQSQASYISLQLAACRIAGLAPACMRRSPLHVGQFRFI